MFIDGFDPENKTFLYADMFFTLLFLAEAIVKIKTWGWKKYWKDGWNKFDFIIVVLALPSLLNPFVDGGKPLAVILVLRTLRIFKTFRLFEFIPNISGLIRGIKTAFKSTFLICSAFLLFLIIFSIITCTLFGTYAPEYFGNPVTSIYSTFRLFTVEGWYEMPEVIMKNGGATAGIVARIYFSILLFLGGIIGMSLINSIFVDSMVADNNDEVLERLKQLEQKLDRYNNEGKELLNTKLYDKGTEPTDR